MMLAFPFIIFAAGAIQQPQEKLPTRFTIETLSSTSVFVTNQHLHENSLHVGSVIPSDFLSWSEETQANSYQSLQKIDLVWKKHQIAKQHLIYGKSSPGENSFQWEMVPFSSTTSKIQRFWRQFYILWRVAMGRKEISDEENQKKIRHIHPLFSTTTFARHETNETSDTTPLMNKDPFCQKEVIEKQLVLQGKHIRVLYNYNPIGLGKERMHFLFTPIAHRTTFSDVTEEEYVEAMKLCQKIMQHFYRTRKVEACYLLHKTGIDAGQTVSHWHLHLMVATSKTEDFWGKLGVLRRMLLPPSPLKGAALKEVVQRYQQELSPLATNL